MVVEGLNVVKVKRRSTPRSRAASVANGAKGGTKSPAVSRWNALKHGRYMNKLRILSEAKFQPEYGDYIEALDRLRASLPRLAPEDLDLTEDYIQTYWRKRKSFRWQLAMEPNIVAGELPSGCESLLRYATKLDQITLAQREQIKDIRRRHAAGKYSPAVPAVGSDDSKPDE